MIFFISTCPWLWMTGAAVYQLSVRDAMLIRSLRKTWLWYLLEQEINSFSIGNEQVSEVFRRLCLFTLFSPWSYILTCVDISLNLLDIRSNSFTYDTSFLHWVGTVGWYLAPSSHSRKVLGLNPFCVGSLWFYLTWLSFSSFRKENCPGYAR